MLRTLLLLHEPAPLVSDTLTRALAAPMRVVWPLYKKVLASSKLTIGQQCEAAIEAVLGPQPKFVSLQPDAVRKHKDESVTKLLAALLSSVRTEASSRKAGTATKWTGGRKSELVRLRDLAALNTDFFSMQEGADEWSVVVWRRQCDPLLVGADDVIHCCWTQTL